MDENGAAKLVGFLFWGTIIGLGIYSGVTGQHIDCQSNSNPHEQNGKPAVVNRISDTSNQNNNLPIVNVKSIYIPSNIIASFNNKFSTEQYEFRLCLYGTKYEDGLLITSYVEPQYSYRGTMGLTATDCDSSSIGFIHSHPNGDCIFSEDDKSLLLAQNKPVQGVICGINRIAFYTPSSLDNSIKVYSVANTSQNMIVSNTDITMSYSSRCPRDDYFCNGTCWHGCNNGGRWRCTPSGGHCDCPQYAPNCAK
jgi:proteasome lid subunit RPN8/RPN11